MKTRRPFRFKQFEVAQSPGCMPVTTEACIFGALADLGNAKSVLDIGTGTGLLSLMLAQRFAHAVFTAIDVDAESAKQATENFKNSPWQQRLRAETADLRNWEPGVQFDAIVSNPPFFDNQLPSESDDKRRARHTVTLDFETLLYKIQYLLKQDGICMLLIPILHGEYLVELSKKYALYLHHKIQIRSFTESAPHVVILYLSKTQAAGFTSDLIIYDKPGEYSSEMKALMQDFYLAG
jgi:tRNA1Val (adenine37-N6)-methyltransferase